MQKCSVLTEIQVSSSECCFTLSPLSGKNEIRHFSDSPYCVTVSPRTSVVLADSKLLSGFQFIGHVNPDNNLESLCMILVADVRLQNVVCSESH
jgi:hypothetical protein